MIVSSQLSKLTTLSQLDISAPKDVLDEVKKGRNISMHNLVMTKCTSDTPRDLDKEQIRVEQVRSLLVAVMARSAGYHGRLWGYRLHKPEELDWFEAQPEPEAGNVYEIDRGDHEVDDP